MGRLPTVRQRRAEWQPPEYRIAYQGAGEYGDDLCLSWPSLSQVLKVTFQQHDNLSVGNFHLISKVITRELSSGETLSTGNFPQLSRQDTFKILKDTFMPQTISCVGFLTKTQQN